MTDNVYALINTATGVVEGRIMWDGVAEWSPPEGFIAVIAPPEVQVGWSYVDGEFIAPPAPEVPPPTPEEVLASQSAKLQQATQLAAAQKTALTNRISVINDAIELEMATPEEIAELPIRQAQLTEWKRYAILLGRVTTQAGWYATVVWPVEPAEGMDLTVSAVAKAVQAS